MGLDLTKVPWTCISKTIVNLQAGNYSLSQHFPFHCEVDGNIRVLVPSTIALNPQFLDMPFVSFLHFGINVWKWSFLGFVHNTSKVHASQPYFQFELPKIRVHSIELINDSSTLTFKWCCLMLKNWGYSLIFKFAFCKRLYALNNLINLNQLLLN